MFCIYLIHIFNNFRIFVLVKIFIHFDKKFLFSISVFYVSIVGSHRSYVYIFFLDFSRAILAHFYSKIHSELTNFGFFADYSRTPYFTRTILTSTCRPLRALSFDTSLVQIGRVDFWKIQKNQISLYRIHLSPDT